MSMGSSDNLAFENHIVIDGEDEKYAIYLYMGSDVPGVEGSDGRPRRNRVYDNSLISDNAVVMMRNTDDNTIEVRMEKRPKTRQEDKKTRQEDKTRERQRHRERRERQLLL